MTSNLSIAVISPIVDGKYESPNNQQQRFDDDMRHVTCCRNIIIGCDSCEDVRSRLIGETLDQAIRRWLKGFDQ